MDPDPHCSALFWEAESGSGSKVKIQEPCRALNAYNGGMEAQHEALEGLQTSVVDLHHFDEEQDRDPPQ